MCNKSCRTSTIKFNTTFLFFSKIKTPFQFFYKVQLYPSLWNINHSQSNPYMYITCMIYNLQCSEYMYM